MYISAAQSSNRKEVIVWERNSLGREEKRYPVPYYFYVKDPTGQDRDIHDNKLLRLDFSSYTEYKTSLEYYKTRGESIYESDIRAEYKVLASHYLGSKLPTPNILFFDIEVDYDKNIGHSTIENPYAPICAIAVHKYWTGKDIVLVVPPPNRVGVTVDELGLSGDYPNVDITICKNEKELLKLFFALVDDSDIISGWNSSQYDVPYVYERAKICFSEAFANKLCFQNAPPPRYQDGFDKKGIATRVLNLYGRASVDYLEIFKKFEVVERRSNSLETISEELFPDMQKLAYDGTLYDLYRDNFEYYIKYNIRDCELLKALEDSLGYMQLAVQWAHSSTGLVHDVIGTIKLAELEIINFCHKKLNARVPDSNYDGDGSGEKFTGALVLFPTVGMHNMVGAVDVASLYPSMMRALNISPETIVGQFFDTYKAFTAIETQTDEQLFFKYETGDIVEHSAKEWRAILLENNQSISGYGSVFSLNKQGFIPAILSDWFAQRKLYKKAASAAKARMHNLAKGSPEYIQAKFEYDTAHRLQYIFKIRLNSLYGALGNKFFKFFDVRLAESTTRSGQQILMHMVRTTAECLDGEYTYPSESTIYSDTDSCYFLTHTDNIDDAIKVARAVESKVNKSFKPFCTKAFLCNDEYNNLISAELDLIASKSIFIKKKYYIMQLAYSEGERVDKMKLMGVQLKKTTIPKLIAAKLTSFMEDLLKGRDWTEIGKEIIVYKEWIVDEASISLLGLPKGIKGINEKEAEYMGGNTKLKLSGHAAAALFYNICLDEYGDKESMRIKSGMKIKTYYLTKKFGRFKSIALPTDMKHPPEWFMTHFCGIIDRPLQAEKLIDGPLANILDALDWQVPTYQNMLYAELVEY